MSKTYKIGEAAALLNLKTYVLRFWETEFPEIVPLRTEKGQRMYAEEHIALLERIRYLLHDRGLTIGGARKALEEERARGVVYSFGVPGAIARDAARPARQPSDIESYDMEDDEDGDESFAPALHRSFDLEAEMHAQDRPLVRRKGQCNLPGIEEAAAMYEDDLAGDDGHDPATSADAQGMLPLFSVAGASRFAGLSPVAVAGANFIRATAPDAPPRRSTAGGEALRDASLIAGPAAPSHMADTAGSAATAGAANTEGSAGARWNAATPGSAEPAHGAGGAHESVTPLAGPSEAAGGLPPALLAEMLDELASIARILQGSPQEEQAPLPGSGFSFTAVDDALMSADAQDGPPAAYSAQPDALFPSHVPEKP